MMRTIPFMTLVKRCAPRRCAPRGFTLIELLVVMVMLGILAALAAPSLRSLSSNQALSSAASGLFSSLLNARTLALSKNQRVMVQPLTSGDWAQGWRLYIDKDSNGSFDSATDEEVSTAAALPSDITVNTDVSNCSTETETVGRQLFGYSSSGFLASVGSSFNGSIKLVSSVTARERCIVVDRSGRARICDPSSSSAAAC